MIKVIYGSKGTGKTKILVNMVEAAEKASSGNVVCVEKERLLTYDINYRARLIETDFYKVSGYKAFYGFLSGICAGDHDITDILIDATLRIGGRDYDELAVFLEKVKELSDITEKNFVFTVSADDEELPEKIFDFCQKL